MNRKTRTLPVWSAVGAMLLVMGCSAQDGSSPSSSTRPLTPAASSDGCGAPWKLVFLTAAQTVPAGSCSSEVAVRLEEPGSTPGSRERAVTLTLSSSAGGTEGFYADAACTQPLSSVSISPEDSTARYFFKEAAVGAPVHEVSAAGLIHATQAQTIISVRPPPPPPPPYGPLNSTCRLQFPPAAGIPCGIDTPGTQYYVSATRGNDGNPGTSAEKPWATLGHALQAAPDGSTLRVAAGTYTDPSVTLSRPLTVKGGFDDTFATWDPDRFHTLYGGRVTLGNDGATFGGFRLVARPSDLGWSQSYHAVHAGTFIRNYVELVYSVGDTNQFDAVEAAAREGRTSRVLCNDIYVRGSSSGGILGTNVISFGANSGMAEASSNRLCSDNNPTPWGNSAIVGYGSCNSSGAPGSVTLTNNIIEVAQKDAGGGGVAVHFYGCRTDMVVTLTNNTVLSSGHALGGYAGESGTTIHWKLKNNVFFSEDSRRTVVDFRDQTIAASGGNLIFGYSDNTLRPAPASSVADDTTGTPTAGTVFQDLARGDFRPRPAGPAVGTGINVHGHTAYGTVTKDLAQQARPVDGAWDRGALLPTGN
jgi:hypothetical protein